MIKLVLDTQAVTASRDADHGLSLITGHQTTPLIILGDSMINDWSAFDVDATRDITQLIHVADVRVAVDAKLTVIDRLRALCYAAAAIAVKAVRNAHFATTWVTTTAAGVVGLVGDWWRRYRAPAGRHRVAATWYGRTRSTAEFVAQLRSARESAGDTREDDLPCLPDLSRNIAFVGWVERYIEVMREEQLVLHPPGRHFICS